ncbi:MAG: hypothetical protein ACYC08_03905, partial [Armatimonadota bacterium]
ACIVRPSVLDEARRFAGQWTWGMRPPGFVEFLQVFRDFNLWQIPEQYHAFVLAGTIYGAFVLILALRGLDARWQGVLAGLWLFVPIFATLAVSRTIADIWMTRYMIYASPAMYLLVSAGLSRVRFRALFLAGLVLPMIVRLGVYYAKSQNPEWRPATAYVQKHLAPGDSVALYRYGNRYIFDYYYSGAARVYPLGPKTLSRSAVRWDDVKVGRLLAKLPEGRVWLALSYGENAGEYQVESYIKRKYRILDRRDFYRVRVYLTEKR